MCKEVTGENIGEDTKTTTTVTTTKGQTKKTTTTDTNIGEKSTLVFFSIALVIIFI